ncbi:MAG: alkaline phosphatase D family protein [Mycobacteriales bacterium]|nr:alkaline phosphatase D family protein [Mycobacteriales bacterium]
MPSISRRSLLLGATAAGVGVALDGAFAATPSSPLGSAPRISKVDDGKVFPQSVASGDPTASGVILWTRVDPARITGRDVLVLEVATDAAMKKVVLRRSIAAKDVRKDRDGTVRVDVDGLLKANRFYFFRFVYRGVASRTGRARTAPAVGQDVKSLRLGVFSCQQFAAGFYGAYRHAMTDKLDYLVHVGDFIYEGNDVGNANGRDVALPSGATVMSSLADCYTVHRSYRSDPDLQRAMEQHTIIATWDDHEIVNNPYYDYDAKAHASGSHPRGDDAAFMRKYALEAAAAYFDWMPVRAKLVRTGTDPHSSWRLYRAVRLGDLADLLMVDGRWYREAQPDTGAENVEGTSSASQTSTMLGKDQANWLATQIRASKATWRVLGNQTIFQPWGAMLPGPSRAYINMDAWDGYRDERDSIVAAFAARPKGNLILTGDMHAFVWGFVQDSYGAEGLVGGQKVAFEVMTSGVTSTGLFFAAEETPGAEEAIEATQFALNPHMRLWNWTRHGYTVVDLTPTHADVTAYVVGIDTADAQRTLLMKGRIPAGEMELEVLERNSPGGLPVTTPPPPALPTGRPVSVRTWDQVEDLMR